MDGLTLNFHRPTCTGMSSVGSMIMHIKVIAAAAYSGTTEFCENSDTAAPSIHRPTTAAHGYFAPLYRDQRPAVHNIYSAL